MRRRGMRDLGAAGAFTQCESAYALFLEQLASRRYQRLPEIPVVLGSWFDRAHLNSAKIDTHQS